MTRVSDLQLGAQGNGDGVDCDGDSVVVDFDRNGVLLGHEVLGATRLLDASFFEHAERVG